MSFFRYSDPQLFKRGWWTISEKIPDILLFHQLFSLRLMQLSFFFERAWMSRVFSFPVPIPGLKAGVKFSTGL
jgi:hypothetical protein